MRDDERMKVQNVGELQAYAVRFAMQLQPKRGAATVVALSGELGAGKTSFVQAVARTFGITGAITSPTFVIEKLYELPEQSGAKGWKFSRLIHIDAYRLEDPSELEVLGFRDLLHDPQNLILIEWPEKAGKLIPKHAIRIKFDIHDDGRTISINGEKEG